MPLYVIEEPHTEEECARAAAEFEKHPRAKELLETTYFQCSFGRHFAWTVAEFADEDEAKSIVPAELRGKITVNPVEVFTFDQVLQAHQA